MRKTPAPRIELIEIICKFTEFLGKKWSLVQDVLACAQRAHNSCGPTNDLNYVRFLRVALYTSDEPISSRPLKALYPPMQKNFLTQYNKPCPLQQVYVINCVKELLEDYFSGVT